MELAPVRLLLGISSGTSADGVDLALVRARGRGAARTVEFVAGARQPYPAELRRDILRGPSAGTAGLARLHHSVGLHMGREARAVLARHGVEPAQLAAAGCHGQTVYHHDGDPADGTLQLGDAAVVAGCLGAPVVGDFRWSDIAAGGQGAPISPFADWVLHRHRGPRLAILNLGGIANFTLLRGDSPPAAWDSGPANGPLDALARAEAGQPCDLDGRVAAQGRPVPDLQAALCSDPFFQRPLPRSTGLERFGPGFAERARRAAPSAPLADLLATLVEVTAWAAADSLVRAGWEGGPVYLCGGGARNPVLATALKRRLEQVPGTAEATLVRSYADLGWDPDLREAVAFALLADAWLCREPASWPSTTGARRPAVLGRLALPPEAAGASP